MRTPSRTRRRPLSEDAGFSLVELAVYIVILGIISTIIAATTLSLFRSEATVSGLTTSASDAQNATTLLRADIRNARQFATSTDGTTVTASVAGQSATVTWQCVRWQVTGTGAERTLTRSTRNDASAQTWSSPVTLLSAIRPAVTGSPYFAGGAASGIAGSLTYNLRVNTAEDGALNVTGEFRNRAQAAVATPATTCFTP